MEKNTENLQKSVGKYMKENAALLKKYKIGYSLIINFPRRRKAPILSRILLKIVQKQGAVLDMSFMYNK